MKLIVGLGNPGREYVDTRQNVGFVVLDRLARRWAPGAVARTKFHAVAVEATVDGERTLLLKPTTFMNRSGQSVSEAIRFYKIEPSESLLIIVDDVALACGVIRLRSDGGPGGHNGLIDVEEKLATDHYARLRIGIDAPGQIPQKSYVLGKFRAEQLEAVEPALEQAVEAAACWATSGCTEAMNRFNRRQIA